MSAWKVWAFIEAQALTVLLATPEGQQPRFREAIAVAEEEHAQTVADRSAVGRPTKIDWDGFWIKIISIANTPDGLPERPELKRMLEQWITDTKQPIGNTSLTDKLAKLYNSALR